jgi:hypothetical protein
MIRAKATRNTAMKKRCDDTTIQHNYINKLKRETLYIYEMLHIYA